MVSAHFRSCKDLKWVIFALIICMGLWQNRIFAVLVIERKYFEIFAEIFGIFGFREVEGNEEVKQKTKYANHCEGIFKRIYEDDITGAISHERSLKLSAEYKAEQNEPTGFAKSEQAAVNTYEQDKTDFDSFAAVIRKYVGIRELTPTIVNEFVKKIIVHAPDKSSGHRRQKVEIVWNFIGSIDDTEDKQTVERQRKGNTA